MGRRLPTTSRCRMMRAGDTSRHSANLTDTVAMSLQEAFATAEFLPVLLLPFVCTCPFEGGYVAVPLATMLLPHQLFLDADRDFHDLHNGYKALPGRQYILPALNVQLLHRPAHQSSSP